jgi:hypothetical protein
VWLRNSYGALTVQSIFTDWITLDVTEAEARSGVSGGSAQSDAGAKLSRIGTAIVDGLNKLYIRAGNTGNLIVGMTCTQAPRLPESHDATTFRKYMAKRCWLRQKQMPRLHFISTGPPLPAPFTAGVKWADLDKNGDGIVDYFTVVHSGYDACNPGPSSDSMQENPCLKQKQYRILHG